MWDVDESDVKDFPPYLLRLPYETICSCHFQKYTKFFNENFLKKKNNNDDDDVEKIYSRFNVLLKCSFSSTHILYMSTRVQVSHWRLRWNYLESIFQSEWNKVGAVIKCRERVKIFNGRQKGVRMGWATLLCIYKYLHKMNKLNKLR